MKLKGIIFDVDGTIADTEEIHRQAFNQTFDEYDINWHWSVEDYRKILFISGGKERFRKFLNEDETLKIRIENPESFVKELHKRKSEHYRSILKNGDIELRPGVIRLINEARDKGIQIGVATSSSMANLTTLFNKTLDMEPSELFNSIVTSDTVQDKKPSPAAYQCVLAGLGLEAESCVAIEDTQNGNLAALAAGLKTIITTHAYTIDNDFTGASIVANHLGEPDQPYTKSQGIDYDKSYVDIKLLNNIISNSADNKDDRTNNTTSNIVSINN
ncbi:MAG TPA: HAD family hydrolase [Thiotrichaceae bacterium]|jgi:HAD superfamily hydrolase (TIGR01509 family)|nr:HAD family hydrolase [Thiotrichaceae bacterium]HIM08826.1 HAD family hydrolase [Gammaproteobacteria bacterium]